MNVEFLYKFAKEFAEKTKPTQHIYHVKSPNFKGKYILPLSELENEYPKLFNEQMKKYKGREAHPEIDIKILNAKWKDCVNLSTINPIIIFEFIESIGIPSNDAEIFKFNIKDFEGKDFCLYDDEKNPKKSEAYSEISIKKYRELQFLPTEAAKYFVKCKEKKEYPLIFGGIVHLLVKGKIDISKAEIIKFKANPLITKF